ncbi:glycoside hydrolase family 2 protein [Tenacibaculum tangerinum]|uniref:Beta-mannosidase B n=1 Tax=Tenacibaculum tangerinum TaxID=3038772 RepID=A0ABY8L4X8_9FLAO|nr:glycoside hydrolase family 2 protein [Tenacibaculum tangerinum]WGH76324.1 glycoside hydrolase family 2 protein [Tenacibaculum tangerinum]
MTNNLFLSLLTAYIFISFVGCQPPDSLPEIVTLSTNWQFKKATDSIWRTAEVPGNIYTDLLQHTLIDDPFVKNNEEKVQWVSQIPWEYKTTFSLQKTVLQKKNIQLQFEGLDTYAAIYLNDSLLLKTDNAFRSYTLNVKNLLRKENQLRIYFTPTSEEEKLLKQQQAYSLPEGNRIFTRKAQFQYGWDWGPKLNTSGIWKPITLKAWDSPIFEDIFMRQDSLSSTEASLTALLTIHSSKDTSCEIVSEVASVKKQTPIHLKKGTHQYTIPFTLKNPTLWWTHNLGTPHLYNFNFKLKVHGSIADNKTVKKGIRTIKLITQKDSIGETFYFELNGKPVYAKGANYIPQHSFQNKVNHKHYEKLLNDVVETNMNMLRVWGGGIYEHDIFYDLCDEKGILVWQDFMFACAMYPGNAEFLANVQLEAEQQVKRLRNHASVALWCGNNENSEGWHRWGWQTNRTEKEKTAIWNDYLAVFDSILPKTVRQFSDHTSYWESSPKYGRGNPKYQFEGDAHDWWVWHDGAPFEHFKEKVPRFMSEFGFQSFPGYEVIRYLNQKDSIDIRSKSIQSHQKHPRGFQLMEEYMQRDYTLPKNDEDYVYMSQLVQARGIVMGIEAHRRAKPYNMGTLYWQLNDCWPAISWSSIDYFGNWKALQYKAKKAFKNLLISSEIKKDSLHLFVVNDTYTDVKGQLELTLLDFEGKVNWKHSKEVHIQPNSSTIIETISLKNSERKSSVLCAKLGDESAIIYLEKPKDLLLPKSNATTTITKINEGFSINIQSEKLLKDVFLFTSEKGHFSDNFFDILPGETIRITFKTKAHALHDLHLKTLNDFL